MSGLTGALGALRAGGGAGSPTWAWEIVADFDFSLEEDQAIDGGNLTFTDQVSGLPVVFAAQTAEIVSGALVLTAAASSNVGVASASTRTGAIVVAAMTSIWGDFDGHAIRWGVEAASAPTYDAANRAWGAITENAVGMGGGNLGHGFSAEVRATGVGAATRQTRWQNDGSTNVASMSTTAYATGLVCGIGLDGRGPVGLWSTTAGDLDELDVASAVGGIGAPGASSGGSPVQGVSRLGAFAVASGAGSFTVSITRMVLWARVARVAS